MATVKGDFFFAALSPCGKFVATSARHCGPDKAKIVVWSTETGTAVKEFAKTEKRFANIAWSRDGKQIAAGTTYAAWNRTYGHHVCIFDIDGDDDTCKVIPNLPDASGKCEVIEVNVSTGKGNITTVKSDWTWTAVYSPNGEYMAVGANFRHDPAAPTGTVHLFKTAANQFMQIGTLEREVRSLSWSPDSTQIVASDNGANMRVFSIYNNSWSSVVGGLGANKHETCVDTVSWSPDGEYIASSSFSKAMVWNVNKGYTLLRKLEMPKKQDILSVEWTPDSQRLAVLVYGDGVHMWSPFV